MQKRARPHARQDLARRRHPTTSGRAACIRPTASSLARPTASARAANPSGTTPASATRKRNRSTTSPPANTNGPTSTTRRAPPRSANQPSITANASSAAASSPARNAITRSSPPSPSAATSYPCRCSKIRTFNGSAIPTATCATPATARAASDASINVTGS